jgi:hypothetical protein
MILPTTAGGISVQHFVDIQRIFMPHLQPESPRCQWHWPEILPPGLPVNLRINGLARILDKDRRPLIAFCSYFKRLTFA